MDEFERLSNEVEEQNDLYRNYYELQLEVNKLNEGLNRCIEIVGESITNEAVNNKLENFRVENADRFKKSENTIYGELNKIKDNIKEINEQLDKLKKDKEE